MEMIILNNILLIFILSIAVLFACYHLHIPAIVGFLLTGIFAGPHALGLIEAVQEVEFLAELGVILLLFTIGIEFSFKNLFQIRKSFLMGGSLQVFLTTITIFAIARLFGLSLGESIFLGFLASLSSTAIVLMLLQERGEIDSPHGRTALGILIFQDIIIIPMILFTPLLAGNVGNFQSPLILLLKGIGIIFLVFIGARWIVPQLLHQIARTRSRELFLLSIMGICLGVALLTYTAGLSLALGAFLAGLIISESEYSHHALSNILPFRDVFTSFFFISIGMLLDVNFFLQQLIPVFIISFGILIIKLLISGLTAILLGFPLRTAILVGFSLSQIGEFSFILSHTGIEHGLLLGGPYQLFLASAILTMAATPFMVALSPRTSDLLLRLPLPERLKSGLEISRDVKRKDHLIIVGFGLNGRNLARAASAAKIPYVIIELNPDTVRSEREKGEPIFMGDASQEAVLKHADIENARIIVIVISDPSATRRITELARRLNPKIYIIVRTRYFQEMEHLYELGADEVIPEEFETSVEIFARVLWKYLVPKDEIEKYVAEIRQEGYEIFRSPSKESLSLSDLKVRLSDVEINTFRVGKRSSVVGKTLEEIELRKKYGITLLAILRNTETLPNPDGSTKLMEDDIVIALGTPDKLAELSSLFYER
ncbi:MAG: cation:proton antiporter domain-containing protein [Candidatus Syntropharchaeia archaeon]